jgi:hypothetical protein
MTPTQGSDAAFVAAVLTLYADLPDTPLRPSPADQSLAGRLFTDAVPLPLIESALLLGTLRRLSRAPAVCRPFPRSVRWRTSCRSSRNCNSNGRPTATSTTSGWSSADCRLMLKKTRFSGDR